MLPDYPEIKRKVQINFQKKLMEESQNDPLIKIFQRKPIYEGNILEIHSIYGHESKEFQSISAEFNIKPEDIVEKGLNAYYSKISEVAEKMKNEQNKLFIENLNEITNKTGNHINCKSKPIVEWYLESLNKSISFDDFGNPIMPDLFINPKDYERIKNGHSKLESDPNIKEIKEIIIERKRREWIDRENNRKLVD